MIITYHHYDPEISGIECWTSATVVSWIKDYHSMAVCALIFRINWIPFILALWSLRGLESIESFLYWSFLKVLSSRSVSVSVTRFSSRLFLDTESDLCLRMNRVGIGSNLSILCLHIFCMCATNLVLLKCSNTSVSSRSWSLQLTYEWFIYSRLSRMFKFLKFMF